MNKDFLVRPNREVLLNYFSVDLHQMDTMKHLRTAMHRVCKKNTNSTFEMFYLFGASDVLLLGISDTCDTLREMQETRYYKKVQGVMDYFMHYGTILSVYPTPFGFKDALKENKILGIINWKIRQEVWLEIFRTHDSLAKIRDILAPLIGRICEQSPEKGGRNLEYNIASVLSSGCEDIILIVLTNSLQFPKFLSTKLRSVEFQDLIPSRRKKSGIKHVTVSTYTVLGVKIEKDSFIYERPSGKQVRDKLRWDCCFNVRPGHLKSAIDTIENKYPKEIVGYPTAGRHDLFAYPRLNKMYTSEEFLCLHRNLIKALKQNHSILSSETYLSFPTLRDAEPAKAPVKTQSSLPAIVIRKFSDLNRDIYVSDYLHILEKESLAQIVRKLQYLLGDRYLRDSFMTLTPIIFSGVRQYIKIKEQEVKSRKQKNKNQVTSCTSYLWTSLVELCFATRYRGSPPVGETAVCPTLGDYSTGEKCLTLLDLLGNRIVKSIIRKYSAADLKPLYVVNISINLPTAATVPTVPIRTAFILLPPRPLFYPQFLLLTFAHELGHVVFNSFSLSVGAELQYEEVVNAIDKLKLEDSIAEFFSIKMLSNMDFAKHKQITSRVLSSLKMERPLYEELYHTKCDDIDLAEALYKVAKLTSGKSIIRDLIISMLKKQNVGEEKIKKLKTDVNFIAQALIDYINLLDSWDDEIIQKVRSFFDAKGSQKEFWNLWAYLHILGMKCYLE